MSASLLIELGTEDLPARYVTPLAEALGKGLAAGLNKRGVTIGNSRLFATPRRIAVLINSVALHQPEQKIERLGPAKAAALKDGKPTSAALGFAKSCGVEFSALGEKDGKLYFAKTSPGRPTAELLSETFEDTLKQMDELVPKRMRWGEGTETFVRPVQWIVALLDDEVVPIKRFGIESSNITYGHRFHAPDAIRLTTPDDYEAVLKNAKVFADVETRKASIRSQIEAEASKLHGTARITAELLDEVTALVEWPVVISGRMEDRFLQLPVEVIVATVETNQRYFTIFDANGKLIPAFIAISNIESRDASQVISGNERVVRPRLTDAMFFLEQDLKHPLEWYGSRLEDVTFQKDIGTIADKVRRIVSLASEIANQLKIDPKIVERAAFLTKNDLVTKMVFEFPELQGLMGGYYAQKSGETAEVAMAIREHYLPTQQGTLIPSTRAGQILSLADKLDTLAGIFAIGQKPTASKDPFGLRRAALGVLRICLEGKLPLDLRRLIVKALEQVRADIDKTARDSGQKAAVGRAKASSPDGSIKDDILDEVLQFVLERLRGYYTDQQLPAEMFEAVRSLNITVPLDFDARVQALRDFWALPAAKNLAAAHKRVRNILKQAGDAGSDATVAVDANLFEHAAEKTLATQLNKWKQANTQTDYSAKLTGLAGLREAVDAFFEEVRVNADDAKVRNNRLALLRELDAACREVADISCLPG